MNTQQLSRLERSERLLSAHCYLMRKPVPYSIRVKKTLQHKLTELDQKLEVYIDKIWAFLNSSMQP
ncbi:hypothetical protein PL84_03545 [Vibrio anguillarum]|uniref:hypothetical protein n=1 Tax=Vibrio anguillarum TaxID=55601 RepID=UPI00097E28DD|nr:hypothetical protein [Vibrio anguillarum]MBT2909655.1 hypothetical protein [Vibrio anguillarum]MBT2942494.1 hypothetical protein [Vibrio anguillarum]MBT2950682.1 hypothetical protein [Vibrio anguillarum]MBT2979419.1 hypothetical protein [Vibrio anguillarum]